MIANHITEAGQGGILCAGQPTAIQAHDNLIAGNTITHCGKIWKHVAGVYVTTAQRQPDRAQHHHGTCHATESR